MCNSLIESKIPSVAAYGSCPQRCLTGAFHRLHELSHIFLGGTFGQVLILIDSFLVLRCPWRSLQRASRASRAYRKKARSACAATETDLRFHPAAPFIARNSSTSSTLTRANNRCPSQPSSGTSTSSSSVIGRTAETALVLRSYRGRSRRVDQRTAYAAHSTVSGDRGSKATSSLHR
jgi:hypothetical protein